MPAMPVESNVTKSIFLAALEKATPAERTAYLEEVCAGDDLLHQRVRALLQAHDQPDPLLDQPAARHLAAEDDTALDFLEPPATPDSLGRLGHYQVLEVIGRGGMGIVLRAFDDKLHRVVAIKVLAPELASNGPARQRFVREARAMAAVIHDNVIAIHEVEDGGPVPYLVMQFIGGGSLQEKLERTGPLPLQEILRLGLQIAEGLAASHRQGLVHRDIKPANILLENDGAWVKITDFGLARAGDDASLTRRHAGLHVAGAGQRRAARRPQRPVQPRLRALRPLHRPVALPGSQFAGGAQTRLRRNAATDSREQPRHTGAGGSGRQPPSRQSTGGALCLGGRGRRPAGSFPGPAAKRDRPRTQQVPAWARNG